jgi:hypothetical protein
VSNPKQTFGTKLDDNSHKLALNYIISTIKTQVNGDVETLNFFNSEITQT